MSLTNVWLQTHSDGLVRADQVIGIESHMTAGLRDTTSHWLLDVVLSTSVGSGFREAWSVTALHRTLSQSAFPPEGASHALAGLLTRLDRINAAGVINVAKQNAGRNGTDATSDGLTASAGGVRFRFVPFATPVPDDRTDAEQL